MDGVSRGSLRDALARFEEQAGALPASAGSSELS